MKKVLIAFATFLFINLLTLSVSAQQNYTFYVVDTFEDGDLNSCGRQDMQCSLNSAIFLSDKTDSNSVILMGVPYKALPDVEVDKFNMVPFYIVKEISGDDEVWKMFPAPLTSFADLQNLNEDVTDYFLTWNAGNLKDGEKDSFFATLFLGQFRKFNVPNSKPNDYDSKISFYRIYENPQDAIQFSNSNDLIVYLKRIESGELYFDKVFLNGFHLRVYEESFSRAVFAIIVTLTFIVVLLNLLTFPNLALYITLWLNGIRRTKVIGLIYDQAQGTPVSFAVLRIYNIENNNRVFLKQTITDLDGKYYGFAVNKGKYLLEVKHNNYETREIEQEIMEDEGLIVADVGMSKSQVEIKQSLTDRIRGYILKNIKDINKALVIFNFLIAVVNIALAQNIFNIFILFIAFIQIIIYKVTYNKRDWGVVLDSATNKPVSAAFIKVFDPHSFIQLNVQLTDERGRFGFVLRKPEYLITVNAVGYKFPSTKDTNARFTNQSGEVFIRLKSPENKRVSLTILVDRNQ